MRVVATCTTLPNRYDTLLNTLRCLRNQTHKLDAIYVTILKKAKRLDMVYPNIPKHMSKLATFVYIDEDYGPICKLYGALIREKDPNTLIISVDDDCGYPDNLVSSLIEQHQKQPNVVICASGALLGSNLCISYTTNTIPANNYNCLIGFDVPDQGRCIDILFGYSGVLYKRSYFPPKKQVYDKLLKYTALNNSVFCNDDILISGYLKQNDIKMMIFKQIPSITDFADKDQTALSFDFMKTLSRFNRCIHVLKKNGMFQQYEYIYIGENAVCRIIIIIIFVLIILYILFRLWHFSATIKIL